MSWRSVSAAVCYRFRCALRSAPQVTVLQPLRCSAVTRLLPAHLRVNPLSWLRSRHRVAQCLNPLWFLCCIVRAGTYGIAANEWRATCSGLCSPGESPAFIRSQPRHSRIARTSCRRLLGVWCSIFSPLTPRDCLLLFRVLVPRRQRDKHSKQLCAPLPLLPPLSSLAALIPRVVSLFREQAPQDMPVRTRWR